MKEEFSLNSFSEPIKLPNELLLTKMKDLRNVAVATLDAKVSSTVVY
jgi:hypothetical protein